jgi:hypothetical protein
VSARTADRRGGFQRLLAEVTLEHVGLIVGGAKRAAILQGTLSSTGFDPEGGATRESSHRGPARSTPGGRGSARQTSAAAPLSVS